MKNIGVKVLIGLCVVLFAVVIFLGFDIKNKNEEIKGNKGIISAKNECISVIEAKRSKLHKQTEELNSKLEAYQELAEEGRLNAMHPIDREVYICMKNVDYVASKARACTYNSIEKWEDEMQKHLLELKKVLTKEEYALLLANQKDWEQYEKSQIKMIGKIYSNTLATIYQDYRSVDVLCVTKYRAEYLDLLLTVKNNLHP